MKYFYEDILREIGEFGPWQKRHLVILWMMMLLSGIQFTLIDYFEYRPDEFVCARPDLKCLAYDTSFFVESPAIHIEKKINSYNYSHVFPKLVKYNQSSHSFLYIEEMFLHFAYCATYQPLIYRNGTCYWSNETYLSNNSYYCEPGPNNHFYFNPAFNIKNLITQHGLLCESLLLYIIGKLSICLGLLLGSLTILTVANKFGRKSAFALASLVHFSGAILQVAFYDYWVIFYVGVFFNNFCKWSLLQLCYIYLTEVAVLRKPVIGWISLNSLVGTSFFLPFIFGKLFAGNLTQMAQGANEYVVFTFVTIIPLLLLIYLPESPRWLLHKYRLEEARALLSSIAKTNKEKVKIEIHTVDVPEIERLDEDGGEILKIIDVSFGSDDKEDVYMEVRKYGYKSIIFDLAVYSASLFVSWFVFSIMRNVTHKLGTFTTSGEFNLRRIFEIVGILGLMLIEGVIGRRMSLVFCLTVIGLLLLYVQLANDAHPSFHHSEKKELIELQVLHSIAVFQAAIWSLLMWFSLSVFPTSMRMAMFGILTCWASFSESWMPFIMEALNSADEDQSPYYIFSFGYFFAAFSAYYLPEILNRPFPDTMDDVLFLKLRSKVSYSDDYFYSKMIYLRK